MIGWAPPTLSVFGEAPLRSLGVLRVSGKHHGLGIELFQNPVNLRLQAIQTAPAVVVVTQLFHDPLQVATNIVQRALDQLVLGARGALTASLSYILQARLVR